MVMTSPSSNELFVVVEDPENQTTAFAFEERIHDLDTAQTRELDMDHGLPLSSSGDWSPTRHEIAFARQVVREEGNFVRLSLLELDTGESRVLADLTEYETVWTIGFSPDGEQIVASVMSFEPDAGALLLVERSSGDVRTLVRRSDSRFTYVSWRPADDCEWGLD
jgi:Tol biopolymer transport system component